MDMIALHQAKNRLTRIVHEVEAGRTVELTRHGKPVAVLLGVEEYRRLCREEAGLAVALHRFYESRDCAEPDDNPFAGLRDRDPGRNGGL